MKISIVDDQKLARDELYNYLLRYCKENSVHTQIEIFETGESFLKTFEQGKYNLIFLDIYLDGIDGINVAKHVRELDSNVSIIFSTNSSAHAVAGFRVRASDYLVKPYDYSDFSVALDYCIHKQIKDSKYIEVKEGRHYVKILVSDIIYTDYYNHYIQIHTEHRVIRSYMPFSQFLPILSCYPQFISCYRNCLVNMDKVKTLEDKDFVMTSGIRIPISRGLKNSVRQIYSDYVFSVASQTP